MRWRLPSGRADPLFRDWRSGDWRLQPESPAFGIGFKEWDYTLAGVRKDDPSWHAKAASIESAPYEVAPVPPLCRKQSKPVFVRARGHENTEWSIAYAYGLTDETRDLPRVLLVGDSVCNGYKSLVRERLRGKMNVSYWISSYCVTSPAYLPLLSVYLDEAKYDVIHFNNGLHSFGTPVAAYENGLYKALSLIREKQPKAKLVWCSSTPLTNAVKTAKCRELNIAAAKVVTRLGGIATNDLFELLNPLDRQGNWRDEYHHKPPLCAKEAERVAAIVLSALEP